MPVCGLEEVSNMVVSDIGMYGAPEVVFLNSRTSAEYLPPSAGSTDGFPVRLKLMSLGEAADTCFV